MPRFHGGLRAGFVEADVSRELLVALLDPPKGSQVGVARMERDSSMRA
ncbi:MAG: hypothetical protein KDA24_21995 [Deltaproteobacteria bacterium]|nr:hypothetical protein [Deltaproteobacteria bacterium]